MTNFERNDELNERLLAVAREYHAPRPTPRDEMWSAITAERQRRHQLRRRGLPIRWGLALAAMLVLGVAIGRWTMGGGRGAIASGATGVPSDVAYQVAAAQYLSHAEVLLTDFRAESRRGRLDPQFLAGARDLLTTTRLMLDSPAARDPHLKNLLEDLELVLAQITQLPAEPGRKNEMDLINQGMDQHSVLTRLRTATPTGPASTRAQGAL
ncbi:MAG TPA: hypothetical protein VI139_04785 [Gemmatimonadales bacterium]